MAFEFDESTATPEGQFDPSTATPQKPAGAMRRMADTGLALGKGIIGVPEAAVGMADLATGGRAGKALESAGVRFKDAKDVLTGLQSEEQHQADQEVADAKGFVPTVGAMVRNPSTIANATAESAPSMILGGAVSRGAMAVLPRLGAISAGAAGEGAVAAGQNAEQVRQEESSGFLTGRQSAVLAGSGALTGAISRLSGGVANKLGIGDVQTMLAAGKLGAVGEQAAAKGASKGLLRKAGEGALVEGGLQELPQSYQEQVGQNIAQGKPWDEGAAAAGAQGMLVGGLMGAVAGPLEGGAHEAAQEGQGGTLPQSTPPAAFDPASAAPAAAAPQPGEPFPPLEGVPPQLPQEPVAEQPLPTIDPDAGPLSRAAASFAGPDGVIHAAVQPDPAQVAAQQAQAQAQQKAQAEQDTTTNPITKGPIAEAQMAPQDLGATLAEKKSGEGTQKGDILNADGAPFANRMAAARRAQMEGGGWVPVPVDGGFAVRHKEDIKPETANAKGQAQQGTATQGAGAKPDAGAAAGVGQDQGPTGAGSLPDAIPEPAGGTSQPLKETTSHENTSQAEAASQPAGQTQEHPGADGQGAPAQTVAGKPADDKDVSAAPEGQSAQDLDAAAHFAATSPLNDRPEPTDAQKKAGNYRKGHVSLHGLDITIENPRGSTRSGKRPDGSTWSHEMSDHYGYVKRTVGADDEQVDVYVGPNHESQRVFVVDQLNQDAGGFDEHKALLGYSNRLQAARAYRSNFDKGWKVGPITDMSVDEFKTWLKEGDTKAPVAGRVQTESVSGIGRASPEQQAGADSRAKDGPGIDRALPATTGAPPGSSSGPSGASPQAPGPTASPAVSPSKSKSSSANGTPQNLPAVAKVKPVNRLRHAAYDRNPFLTFLATHGLYHETENGKRGEPPKPKSGSQKSEFSPDKQIMVMGYGPVFRKTGLKPDVLVGRAIEDGYLPQDGTESQLVDLIRRAVGGEKIQPLHAEGVVEAEFERQMQARAALDQDRAQDDNAPVEPELEQEAYDQIEALSDAELLSIDDDIPWDAPSNASDEDFLRAMGASDEEIARDLAQKPTVSPASTQARAGPEEAPASQAPRDRGQGDAQARPGAEPEGLSAPTREDVLAQQDRAAQAAKDDATQQRRLTDKAKADAERDEFALTGSERAADVAAAGGQKDIFSAPAEPEPPAADAAPATSDVDILDAEAALWARITDGTATPQQFKAGFDRWVNSKAEITEQFAKKKKDDLLKMGGGMFAYRYKGETKPEIVEALWRDGAGGYSLGRGVTYSMGKDSYVNALRTMVDATDADQLAQYAQQRKAAQDEVVARAAKKVEAIADPKSLEDYRTWMRATTEGGKTFKEARLLLTPAQRADFDTLTATETRGQRKTSSDAQKARVSVAGQTVDGDIIATKHTKKGHDLFVVKLAERVSREDYETLNTGAKKIGGYYSSFRGGGAIAGFQFTTREQAQAFVKLAQGDTSEAQAAAQDRRDAFADDRSQTAVQRLTEMATALESKADESLGRERKANTERRARFAASAEAEAQGQKALAKTMRNIADAIDAGRAQFLDRVRQKAQVEMLQGYVRSAKDIELRTKHESYSDQERHKGEAPTGETADFAEFPTFTAFRSDLASLGRQLIEVEGTKLLGQRIMKMADDVSDAYLKFAKEHFSEVAKFSNSSGKAGFTTKGQAEAAIARSGYKGKAIAFQVKRGEHAVILSPSEAIDRGVWKGDADKRITLAPDLGDELVQKIGRAGRRGAKVAVPWQLETAHDRRKRLATMGIETPAEFRAALREFIGLREQAAAPDKVKQLERAMVGRKNDGLDFFPTPEETADAMIDAAGIEPGMRVLEPSAGMGHIADRIREQGVEPQVAEVATDRRELLEAKGFDLVARDFLDVDAATAQFDRIVMNPPFSNGRDIEHVRHAFDLLAPGGRLVALMGESAFTNQQKKATDFREWLDSVGGTEEKLPEGTFQDPSLPVNTGANARMVVIDKPQSTDGFDTVQTKEDDAGNVAIHEPDAPYETDLFGNPLPEAAKRAGAAVPAAPGVRGDVQPKPGLQDTPAPPGKYFTRTIVGSTAQREVGAARVTTPEQAAQATRYLYKSAVERLDGIVTDKDGKVLAVVGGFKGALAQASIYPGALMGEAVRIPGAANIWFSHNHPSGSSTLSRADEMLNETLTDVFRGSGIEPRGLMAVAGGRFSHVTGGSDSRLSVGAIPQSVVHKKVPVIERELADGAPGQMVSSPMHAKAIAKQMFDEAKGPGLMLLNSQNQVIGWVPISKEMTGPLRGTGQLNALYRAISESNAGAAIIVHGGELDQKTPAINGFTPVNNIAAALNKLDVRVLDSINAVTGQSTAERGLEIARGPVFARSGAPFYSALSKEVGAIKANAQGGLGWAMNIAGLVKAGKVKQDEVEWSGVLDWLKLQAGKVSKDAVREFLDANGVQVEETVLGEGGKLTPAEQARAQELTEAIRTGDSTYEDEDELERLETRGATPTKYSNYQLPGGTNYREVLLTLPVKTTEPTGEVVEDGKDPAYPFAIMVNGKEENRVKTREFADSVLKDEMDRVRDSAAKKGAYQSGHWDQPNVLAHIRVNDRTDADGKKVLFVEEIQSDWGQQGKKTGFKSEAEKQRLVGELDRVRAEKVAVQRGEQGTGAAAVEKVNALQRQEFDLIDEYNRKINDGVPSAPFVGKTEAWVSLALRRIVKMAADGGYDKVAFINGEQSADRYDLSKQVRSIAWTGRGNDTEKTVTITPNTGNDMELRVQPDGAVGGMGERGIGNEFDGKRLDEIVGKDVAERILGAPYGDMRGDGLKVGGDGMKAFYDKIVPNTMKEVLKKLGGGQMEPVDIGYTKGEQSEYSMGSFTADNAEIKERAPGVFQVWAKNDRGVNQIRGGNFRSRAEAQKYIDDMAPGQTQPGFTITPSMHEKAADGVPQFSRGAGRGVHMSDARAIVAAVREALPTAPPIHIMESVDKAPEELRQHILDEGAENDVDAAYHDGGIYVFPKNIGSIERMQFVLAHHEIRHHGLRSMLGAKLGPILLSIHATNPKIRAAAAEQVERGYAKSRVLATEEALADMPVEDLVKLNGWDRIVAAVREWLRGAAARLRRAGLAGVADAVEPATWTDKDVAALISRAEGVSRGGTVVHRTTGTVFGQQGDQTSTPAFKAWFGGSKVVDADGKPLVVYHGTTADFNSFDAGMAGTNDHGWYGKGVYLSADPGTASAYTNYDGIKKGAKLSEQSAGGNVMPVYVSLKNPYVWPKGRPAALDVAERDALTKELTAAGYDGVVVPNEYQDPQYAQFHEIIAFQPEQIKSAIGNRGTFDATNPDIRFARSQIAGQTARQYTPEQLRAMKNVGFEVQVPTLKERAQALWKDAGKKIAQGVVDQFAPVKNLDKEAYGLLRLSKGASGAFESFLHGGKLRLTDNVYDFDDQARGGVVDKLLIPLQGEHHDFMRWVAANRAERLMGEGKENLFSEQDIADIKTLASGQAGFDYTIQNGPRAGQTTRERAEIYRDALATFNGFNKNILDMAEQSGLIDGDSRKIWEHEFYVPFYRVADDSDGGVRGMNIKGGVVRQQAFKALKGGTNALNTDLLDNTLMNWAHLLDAAAKNRAAKATIEAAERMGAAAGGNQATLAQMATSINNKNGVVWFMDGGVKRYSLIDDPYLMTAITALEYAGMRNPVMNAMSTFKHALTIGVTASPFFKVRNLIRDSVQAIGTGNLSYNPFRNIGQGWKLTDPKSDAYFRLMAGGGTIHFGTMLEGSEAKRVQALVEAGVEDATLLNSEHKVKQFYRKFVEPGITAYNELGNRGEAINRASLYDQLRKQGLNHADASLQARDLMDFSMQGSFTTIRFLTQVVPFFNARIQGLYKLGRAAKEDPQRFAAVLGATALFSLGLLAAYSDDDDWKKREEWDRNNYWWFKFGGTAFRIPKPFEIGAIATLAERGFELAFDKEMTGTRFRKQVLALLGDNLSMNPVPQLIKPIVDVYANQDSFSGRPIETLGMERLQPEYRFTDRTSMAARGASTALNAVTGAVGVQGLSPVQIDHMLRGYFGWLGTFIVGAGDVLARPATSQPIHPAPDYWREATGGMVSDLRDAPSRYVSQMYDQAKVMEQAYGTWRTLLKEGKPEEARQFRDDNQDAISRFHRAQHMKKTQSKLNEQIRVIERSDMDASQKREAIRAIQIRKDQAARLAPA